MLIDTHCHLDFSQFDDDRDAVIRRAQDNKVAYLINVGSSLTSSFESNKLSDKYHNIFFSIGFHPHYADKFNKDEFVTIEPLTKSEKLVAIGEIGLDYYRNLSSKNRQREVFIEFIVLAKRLNLPLIIHCRESQSDIFSILKNEFSDFRKVVFHCFCGPEDFLDKCLKRGAFFSFTANVTYPKATQLRELVEKIPLENIMLETDSPYLAPEKFRGQRNEPSYIHLVAQELASIKGISFSEVAHITTQNAKNFFGLV